jgi:hypothetical protein
VNSVDLTAVFKAIGTQMLTDFEHSHSQIKHLGERGGEREAALGSFLKAYLPGRYAISDGEIVDGTGQTSRQCDLVIYDHLNCPLLLAGKGYRVFPAEPVFAVIEVKSVLTAGRLKDAVEKIRSVKEIKRDNGSIAGILFAYKSGWQNDEPILKIASKLGELNKDLLPHQYTDLLCVLDSGIIEISDGKTDPSKRLMKTTQEWSIPILLLFFMALLSLLGRQVSDEPEYDAYVDPEGMLVSGISTIRDSTGCDADWWWDGIKDIPDGPPSPGR